MENIIISNVARPRVGLVRVIQRYLSLIITQTTWMADGIRHLLGYHAAVVRYMRVGNSGDTVKGTTVVSGGPPGSRSYVVCHGLMWSVMVLCGPSRSYVVRHGHMWSVTVLCGPSRSYVVRHGHMWSVTVLCGPSRSYVVLGLLWS